MTMRDRGAPGPLSHSCTPGDSDGSRCLGTGSTRVYRRGSWYRFARDCRVGLCTRYLPDCAVDGLRFLVLVRSPKGRVGCCDGRTLRCPSGAGIYLRFGSSAGCAGGVSWANWTAKDTVRGAFCKNPQVVGFWVGKGKGGGGWRDT